MSTKAEIQALIDSDLASASSITAVEHRNVLINDTDSVVEQIYPDIVPESTYSSFFSITEDSGNFDYLVYFCKTGRRVNINGTAVAIGNQSNTKPIFEIVLSEYLQQEIAYGIGTITNSGTVPLKLNANVLSFVGTILNGERVEFDFNYNVIN